MLQQEPLSWLVLDTITDGVIVANQAGEFVLWNPAATEILGLGAGDVPPEQWSEHYNLLDPLTEAQFPADELPLLRALRGLDTDDREILVWNPRTGKKVLISCSARPLHTDSCEAIGGVVFFRDITEQRRVEEELRSFAHSVSHDLRAPLTGITGFVSVLEEGHFETMDKDAKECVGFIKKCTERMHELIGDLLDHASLAGGGEPVEVELSDVMADVLENLRTDIEASAAKVSVDDPLPSILGYRGALTQMLQNLLANAIKFVAPGVRPEVRIGCEDADDTVQLRVQDCGIGIDPRYQRSVFDIFRRLHSLDDYPGTGIGLAIVKKAVELHRGSMRVTSAENEGSTFWIQLPKTPPPA